MTSAGHPWAHNTEVRRSGNHYVVRCMGYGYGPVQCGFGQGERFDVLAEAQDARDDHMLATHTHGHVDARHRRCMACKAARRRGRGQPSKHRCAPRVCIECGMPWPCPTWHDEQGDRCNANPNGARMCPNRALYDGLCRIHWLTAQEDT